MIQQSHFSVNIRSGLDGPIMQEYDSENARNTRFIEATTDATICPQIVIHKKFQWHGADGLYVAIRYGSKPYQVAFWVPKPSESFSDAEDDWSFQIPGKNILDKATKQLVGYEYRVADLNDWKCDQINAVNCLDVRRNDSKYLGSVWVSIKRQNVRPGFTPTSIADYLPVHPPQKVCQHSIAVSSKGIRHTFKRKQIAPLDMGTMISDPKPQALLDTRSGGQWMNSVFIFRPRDQLVKPMNSEVKSELQASQLGPNINISPTGVNVATSEPSSKTATPAPAAIMHMSEKRRGAPLENQIGTEESSSLHDITSHKHKRPRKDAVMRSSGSQRDSVGSHSPLARPHQVPYNAGNEEDETEDVDEETEREQLLNIFKKKAGQSKHSDQDRRTAPNLSQPPKLSGTVCPPSSETRSSKPDLSSVLTEEYRKLREASKANRRSKSKNVHTSKSPSISSNQSAESSTLRVVIPKTQFTSREQSISSEEESNSTNKQDSVSTARSVSKKRGMPSQQDTRSTTMQRPAPETPVPASSDEETGIKLATPEKRIRALRQKKELLQKQLEDKLMAECEELERQINQ